MVPVSLWVFRSAHRGMNLLLGCRLTAQLIGPQTKENFTDGPHLEDMDLLVGAGRSQYSSFSWPDLEAIAPWLELTKRIDGPGLGH